MKGKGLTEGGNTCKHYKKQDMAKPIMTDRQLLKLRADIEEGLVMIADKKHYYAMEAQNKNLLSLVKRIKKHLDGGGSIQPENGVHIAVRAAIKKASP